MPEDYLLRLARQMGQMLASLLGFRKEGRKDEMRQEIERLSLDGVGLPWATVRQASPEWLLEHLRGAGGLRHHRAILLAELLVQEADLAELEGKSGEAIRGRLQAFCLISDVLDMLSIDDLKVYEERLAVLAQQLEPASAHPYLREKLQGYWDGREKEA